MFLLTDNESDIIVENIIRRDIIESGKHLKKNLNKMVISFEVKFLIISFCCLLHSFYIIIHLLEETQFTYKTLPIFLFNIVVILITTYYVQLFF